jgi:hypothetical protein
MPEQQIDDKRAADIVRMAEHEKFKATNFRNLYQQVADLMYPVENQITNKKTPGEDKSLDVRDPTAIWALNRATAGFISAWIPKERNFFGIRVKNRQIGELDNVKRWCALATQIAHDEMFESNYMSQLQQTIKSTIGFGTGCNYSEWSNTTMGLSFKDWHISMFTLKQNAQGRVDTVIIEYSLTARQAANEFKNPGEEITKNANDLKDESKLHQFIHVVRPRSNRNVQLVNDLNKPFESLFVNVKEKRVVEEGGFDEFPFAVPRWERSSSEKYGRGCGTTVLSAVKELQWMRRSFVEVGELYAHPPLWKKSNDVEGEINMSPDGITNVMDRDAFGAVDQRAMGNFLVTKDMLEFQQNMIKNDGFYNDIFSQFRDLKGDRRVTLELELRNQEGLDQLGTPVTNMEGELFTPQATRAIMLLIRNGRIPMPPPELQGQAFGIEYMGKLAMAMKQYQARGFMQFTQTLAELDPVFPGAKDMVSMERALPDIAIAMGLKVEHLATPEEIAAKRQKRAQDEQQAKIAQIAEIGSKAYKNTAGAPEEGSPAAMVGAMG